MHEWDSIIYLWPCLEHKTSLKTPGYIGSNIHKYIVWVKLKSIRFFFYAKNH